MIWIGAVIFVWLLWDMEQNQKRVDRELNRLRDELKAYADSGADAAYDSAKRMVDKLKREIMQS